MINDCPSDTDCPAWSSSLVRFLEERGKIFLGSEKLCGKSIEAFSFLWQKMSVKVEHKISNPFKGTKSRDFWSFGRTPPARAPKNWNIKLCHMNFVQRFRSLFVRLTWALFKSLIQNRCRGGKKWDWNMRRLAYGDLHLPALKASTGTEGYGCIGYG